MNNIYLDYSATTPLREEILKETKPYLKNKFGNPSSFHKKGLEAKKAIEKSREKIAKILNVLDKEIIFTGSGTESINLAIKGIAFREMIKGKKGHFITQKTEHDAVLQTMNWLEKNGFEITYINVDEKGIVKLDELKKAIRKDTLLVSIMYANNEIGTIQPLKKISKICHEKKVPLHSDACQAGEYLNIDIKKLGLDLMTLNGSKIYSYKGTGILYKNEKIKLEALIHGGHHEFNLRSGTENVLGIVGMAKALELAENEKNKEKKRLEKLRNYFIKEIKKIPKTKINGSLKNRLPNNINASFYGIEGESLLLMLNEKGIYASTGSACSSKTLEASHVLRAIGLKEEWSHSSIRFSLGKYTTKKEINYTLKHLKKNIKKLRTMSPIWSD